MNKASLALRILKKKLETKSKKNLEIKLIVNDIAKRSENLNYLNANFYKKKMKKKFLSKIMSSCFFLSLFSIMNLRRKAMYKCAYVKKPTYKKPEFD